MLITARIWICLNTAFVLRVKGMMFVTLLGPYFAGFGADTALLQRAQAVFTDCLSVINAQRNANGVLSVSLLLSAALVPGMSHSLVTQFRGRGGESLLVAKKSNSNQCKWELGAASCNPGQYVRLLQSSRNRAVNQSSGLASPQWKLGFLHWRWSSSLQRLQRLFLMWSTCLCHKLTYISMPKQCSNLSPCIAPQMAYLTLNT